MESLDDQIMALQTELANLQMVKKRLRELKLSEAAKKQQKTKWGLLVEKEYQDIINLDKKGFADLFFDLQAERASQLEKEKQEYLEAVIKYKNVVSALQLVEFEIKVLSEKVEKLPKVKKQLKQLLAEKRKLPLDVETKAKIKALDTVVAVCNRLKNVILQVMKVGDPLLFQLDKIEGALNKIATWSNSNLDQRAKNKIFSEEFDKIEEALNIQHAKMMHFGIALQKLMAFEGLNEAVPTEAFTELDFGMRRLRKELEHFEEDIINGLINNWGLQGEVANLNGEVKRIAYDLKEVIKTLQRNREEIEKQTKLATKQKSQILNY